MIPASRQRNYLQSALYVIIVGVLAAVLLERLLTYAEAAEKAAMEATVSRLHAGLYIRLATYALKGYYDEVDALAVKSPFAATEARASNYLGEFDGVPGNAEGGNWLYDRSRHELVYVPNLKRYLESGSDGGSTASIRFRVEVVRTSQDAYTRVLLRPVVAFKWNPVP